jgi:hypothetical protein
MLRSHDQYNDREDSVFLQLLSFSENRNPKKQNKQKTQIVELRDEFYFCEWFSSCLIKQITNRCSSLIVHVKSLTTVITSITQRLFTDWKYCHLFNTTVKGVNKKKREI